MGTPGIGSNSVPLVFYLLGSHVVGISLNGSHVTSISLQGSMT